MPSLYIEVTDATEDKRQKVGVPGDAPVRRVIPALVNRLGLPRQGTGGQPLAYQLRHHATDRLLLDTKSLSDSGVKDGDVLRLLVDGSARDDGRVAPTDMRPCPSCGEPILVVAK